jgi:hypothetical protein
MLVKRHRCTPQQRHATATRLPCKRQRPACLPAGLACSTALRVRPSRSISPLLVFCISSCELMTKCARYLAIINWKRTAILAVPLQPVQRGEPAVVAPPLPKHRASYVPSHREHADLGRLRRRAAELVCASLVCASLVCASLVCASAWPTRAGRLAGPARHALLANLPRRRRVPYRLPWHARRGHRTARRWHGLRLPPP